MTYGAIRYVALFATLLIIWLIPALFVSRVAGRRGYNPYAGLIFGLVIPWPVALLVVSLAPRRRVQTRTDEVDGL